MPMRGAILRVAVTISRTIGFCAALQGVQPLLLAPSGHSALPPAVLRRLPLLPSVAPERQSLKGGRGKSVRELPQVGSVLSISR